MSKFSERFRELKNRDGLTLKDLSKELNITVPNLSYYMKGREPSYDILISIANYFDVTVDWLIGRETSVSKVEDINNELLKENTFLKKKLKAINDILQLNDWFCLDWRDIYDKDRSRENLKKKRIFFKCIYIGNLVEIWSKWRRRTEGEVV